MVCAVCLVGSVAPRTQAVVREDEVETTSNLIPSAPNPLFQNSPEAAVFNECLLGQEAGALLVYFISFP